MRKNAIKVLRIINGLAALIGYAVILGFTYLYFESNHPIDLNLELEAGKIHESWVDNAAENANEHILYELNTQQPNSTSQYYEIIHQAFSSWQNMEQQYGLPDKMFRDKLQIIIDAGNDEVRWAIGSNGKAQFYSTHTSRSSD